MMSYLVTLLKKKSLVLYILQNRWSKITKVLGSNPTTKNDKNDKNGTRHDRHDEGEVHENREREGGPRTGETWYSQGTMNREPKYGGGALPKYGSCRGLSCQDCRQFGSWGRTAN